MKHLLRIVCLFAASTTVQAALTVSENFGAGSPGSSIIGLGGGTGFSDNWHAGGFNASNSSVQTVGSGSLAYGGMPVSGNKLSVGVSPSIAGIERTFTQSLGATGTTQYISLLLKPEGVLGAGVFNGFFGLALEGPSAGLFVGKPGGGALNQWVIETRGGPGQVSTGVNLQIGVTTLLVIKAEFLAGNDRFTLYVNPTPGGPEPAIGTLKTDLDLGTVFEATIYSSGAFSADALMIGDSFASVTPVAPVAAVPEPGTAAVGFALLGACGAGLLRRNRRATASAI